MVIKIDPENPSEKDIKNVAVALKNGGVVVFPTETLYGLGAKASDEEVLKKIYHIKRRSARKPLPVMISDIWEVKKIAPALPEMAKILAERYWPGPLTLVMKSSPSVSSLITCGRDTVGIRIPANRIALDLLKAVEEPVAVTSANISREEDILTIDEIISYFEKEVDIIVDGGPLTFGVPSTVLDITSDSPVILREGKIPSGEILAFLKSKKR